MVNVSSERALLGAFVLEPSAWSRVKALHPLCASDFTLSSHQKIFSRLSDLAARDMLLDLPVLMDEMEAHNELETIGGAGYLAALIDGTIPENVLSYARQVIQGSKRQKANCEFDRLHKQLADTETAEHRLALLDAMREVIAGESAAQNWRGIFHTVEEFENAPPLRFAIEGFLQEAGVTLIGGLAGHGKTLIMLAMAKALLEESPLFGYEPFSVPRPAQRVLYLIPESSLGPFWSRIELFRLQAYVRTDRLLVRTLSSPEQVSLDDVRLLKAAEGADVFLDTAVRFMDGSENDVESARPFADTLFRLLNAGAQSISGAHHSPKGFEGQDYMTLENILRGSGDLGAMLCTCWGVRQIDGARNQLYIQNVKPRDFQPCAPFILEGRPHLDSTGQFKILQEPGEAGELSEHLPRRNKGGRPAVADKDAKMFQAVEMRRKGSSVREIAKTVGVPRSTVDRWLFDYDASQKCPTVGQFRDKSEPDGETPN
jgi:DnaB-like helicase N terminal domain/AAA domain/Homeodomain-like domain